MSLYYQNLADNRASTAAKQDYDCVSDDFARSHDCVCPHVDDPLNVLKNLPCPIESFCVRPFHVVVMLTTTWMSRHLPFVSALSACYSKMLTMQSLSHFACHAVVLFRVLLSPVFAILRWKQPTLAVRRHDCCSIHQEAWQKAFRPH